MNQMEFERLIRSLPTSSERAELRRIGNKLRKRLARHFENKKCRHFSAAKSGKNTATTRQQLGSEKSKEN